eukprot:GHVN01098470.1.p2 GENE.GHVN01098470.1~~GHVN01098470.1.p2  ORF type:complete len:362 (-),score=43.03 GHVN01098470.1:1266-2351(-)
MSRSNSLTKVTAELNKSNILSIQFDTPQPYESDSTAPTSPDSHENESGEAPQALPLKPPHGTARPKRPLAGQPRAHQRQQLAPSKSERVVSLHPKEKPPSTPLPSNFRTIQLSPQLPATGHSPRKSSALPLQLQPPTLPKISTLPTAMSSQVPAPPHLMLPPQTLSGPQNSTSGETHPTTVSKAHPHQATPAPEFTTPTIEIPPSFPIVAKKGSISALGEHSAPTQALAKPNMSQGAPALATQQPGISELPPPWTPPSPRTTRLSLPQPAPKRFSGETCQPPQALIPHKYSLPQELHHRTPIKHIEIAVTPAIPNRYVSLPDTNCLVQATWVLQHSVRGHHVFSIQFPKSSLNEKHRAPSA